MPLRKEKGLGGKPRDNVWEYFHAINVSNDPHKSAQCKFCNQLWKRGRPNKMKAHLALKCTMVTQDIKVEYLKIISNEDVIKPSTEEQQSNNNQFDEKQIIKANKALTRLFICCGIPFSVVDSPFFHDFTKSLCYRYEPPKRLVLSTQYLDAEIANVKLKTEEELRHSTNLTLG